MNLQSKHTSIGIKSFFISLFVVLCFISCNKPPEFSETPQIAFDTIVKSVEFDQDLLTDVNNVIISINFQDGDGDLGVLTEDINNADYRPYSDTTVIDTDTIFTFKNYYLEFYRKNGDGYDLLVTQSSFDGTFEPLIGYDEVGPIEGSLSFEFSLIEVSALSSGFVKNDTVRFDVFIVDRALNESNVISTSDIALFTD